MLLTIVCLIGVNSGKFFTHKQNIVSIQIASISFLVVGLELEVLEVPNPPPEQVDAEWVMIPDEDGNLHLVNVISALNEPQPMFHVESGVIFELYTKNNPHHPHILRSDDVASMANSNFDPNIPTRFVAHGWNSKGDLTNSFCRGYFEQANLDVNFIAINWQAGANTINYISARNRVPLVR